jgi:two-component system cell cycle sensor histidine kinase/response regulator CckA
MPAKTALIVDDEATVRLYIKAVLQQQGFETVEAADSLEALRFLRNDAERVDLLLSDVQMPRMDGIALARAVRTEFPAIPLILVSGYCSREEAPDLAVSFIPKPFTPATLLTAIGCVMTPKKEPRAETEPPTSTRDRKAGG